MITTTEAFKNLSPEEFGLLLARDSLNVPSEQTVVQSLETWIYADSDLRSKSLEDLLPNIRASFLPSQSIDDMRNFLVNYRNPDLCLQLNFDDKTPRQGYEQCIVAVHKQEKEGRIRRSLKYLDTKVWFTGEYFTKDWNFFKGPSQQRKYFAN